MKPSRASMIIAGLWVAVTVASCGVGGEEGAREATIDPVVPSSTPSSVSAGAQSAAPVSRDASVASRDNPVEDETDNPLEASSDDEGNDGEAEAILAL